MASLHYLTVQDILWINLQVTKKVQHFNYARLEEAAFYQYAYGDSNTVFKQAAQFVTGFRKMRPFDSGNDATAFVSCLAFLKINGYVTGSGEEMSQWYGKTVDEAAIAAVAITDPEAHHALVPDVRGAVESVLDNYSELVNSISNSVAA